jgi:hypothetical protein
MLADGCQSSWSVQESASPGTVDQPNRSGRSERQRQSTSRRNHACVIGPDRASLLLALAAHVDEHEDLQAGIAAVQAAPDAVGQIRAWAQMQAWRNPKIAPLARALDQARHTDQAASAAWRDRTDNRMRGAAAIITRLREEGRLHPSWTTSEAATLLWELTSFRVWDDLVNESGLTPDRYVEIVTTAALAALASPLSEQASPSPGSP